MSIQAPLPPLPPNRGPGGPPMPPGNPPPGMIPPGAPLPPAQQADPAPEDEMLPHPSFWQQPWVQNILPFVTSLGIHAALVLIVVIFFAAPIVIKAVQQHAEEQTVVPESTMAESGPPGGVPNVGTGGDPLRQAMQNTTPDAGTPDGWASKQGALDAAVANEGGGAGDADASGLIGIGAGGMGRGGGIGGGSGPGTGGGSGDGGPLAMFGTPGGGGIGPKGPVFGNGGNARKIIFVCDSSGSMISKMASLKNELTKAITGLKAVQQFNVIFFQDNNALVLNKDGMMMASQDNKRSAYKYLDDVTTTSTSDPLPALRVAFKQQPQLIYLLTDGDFPDNKAVLEEIRKLDKDRKIKVNTIAFVNDKDTDTDFIPLLQSIAKETGGTFKHVAENELNQ
jgi:hypothetical protein